MIQHGNNKRKADWWQDKQDKGKNLLLIPNESQCWRLAARYCIRLPLFGFLSNLHSKLHLDNSISQQCANKLDVSMFGWTIYYEKHRNPSKHRFPCFARSHEFTLIRCYGFCSSISNHQSWNSIQHPHPIAKPKPLVFVLSVAGRHYNRSQQVKVYLLFNKSNVHYSFITQNAHKFHPRDIPFAMTK